MKQALGIFFYCKSTDRFLYLLRNDSKHPGVWGLPGGGIEADETLLQAAQRECTEELGTWPDAKLIPIQKFTNENFVYNTLFCAVDNEFMPSLNHEHSGYAWVGRNNNELQYPKPLHPGLFSTVNFDIVLDKLSLLTQNTSQ